MADEVLPMVPEAPGRLIIRLLSPHDLPAIEAHYVALGAHDRRLRFFGAIGDAGIGAHCRRIDWARMAVLGAARGGALVGVAELALPPPGGGAGAELGLSVDVAERRRGTGARLLAASLALARNRCAGRLTLRCLEHNLAMRGLAGKFGASLRFHPGEVSGGVAAPWPSLPSLFEEAAITRAGWLHAVFDLDPSSTTTPQSPAFASGRRAA